MAIEGMWIRDGGEPDTHAAFRGRFTLAAEATVAIELIGSGWWELSVDGKTLEEGQPRYHPSCPEHLRVEIALAAGEHFVAIHAQHLGVHTRFMRSLPPFLRCRVLRGAEPLAVAWRARRLRGYRAQVARINPQLGWCGWLDSRVDPPGWTEPRCDDTGWDELAEARVELPEPRLAEIQLRGRQELALRPLAQGRLAEAFGYELDDPPARFLLRQLDGDLPPQGVWRRYDLGRVRLGRPRFTIDAPAGAVVEWAMAESLRDGRVAPYITLSAGRSCNLDHVVARGGPQVFEPTAAKGGRFLEVHVLAPPESVRFLDERFVERGYFGEPIGSFACGDATLDAVWRLGAETLRACAEDAVTDNPTRERGQWTGDAVIALETAAAAFGDFGLMRRALAQAALDVRDDGLVSGLSPADSLGMPGYAAQWVGACLRYHELTGDRALLEELRAAAERNLAAMRAGETADGLGDAVGWSFIDWGYARPPGPVDLALNLHYLAALRAMVTWVGRLEKDASRWQAESRRVAGLISVALDRLLAEGGWSRAGYHVAVLALLAGLDRGRAAEAVTFIKSHLLACFPNDLSAPRLSDPGVSERRLITPYFAHFTLEALLRAGEADFVLAQHRACWGWMLAQGATTCLEVFETRWSHCHQWSACPTWQLTRHALGLRHAYHRGRDHLELALNAGSLPGARGRVPLGDGGHVDAEWSRASGAYRLSASRPVTIHIGDRAMRVDARIELPVGDLR
jgi:hypothetical protein